MLNDFFAKCYEEVTLNHPCVLATVLERVGSAPRGAGANMLVFQDASGKRTMGTVGGGALEHAVELRCLECQRKHRSSLLRYHLAPNEGQDLGMVCGGDVTVYCHYLCRDKDGEWLQKISDLPAASGKVWLVRRIAEDQQPLPVELYADQRLWMNSGLNAEAVAPLCGRKPVLCGQEPLLFVQPIGLEGHTYVFGGGHIARQLVPLLQTLAFAPVVYDDRPEFASDQLFPDAERVILGAFDAIAQRVCIREEDCAVIMTRGHAHDHELLTQVLRTPAYYIGLIGSRSKIGVTKALLLQEGFTETDFARIHTPIGLPIGAETPEEIAVSIAAEMILNRARRNGSPKAPKA